MFKAYKYRIYPNALQIELIQKTFGCCRFVYNQCLTLKIQKYKNEQVSMSKIDCNNYVNQILKNKFVWLKEVDKYALTNSIFAMDNAYQNFFKQNFKFPKFKSKRFDKKSYTTNCVRENIEVAFTNNKIKLPKLSWVKAKVHRKFTGKIKSATVSQVPSGKYFVSILVDAECESMKPTGCVIGIDLGIKDLIITSSGDKYDNIRTTKKYEDKLVKEQRKLSHKIKGSKNYEKQRVKIARIHEKIHNTRLDNLHKISHKLISENQVIVSENLNVSNMIKNHSLAKAISDCGWYELTRQLQYKADWNNRDYVKIDRFFKSSQLCSKCGYINPKTKDLTVREWICPKCGEIHDRDINASKNILNEGLKILQAA